MTIPNVICLDCGHEGSAIKKNKSFFGSFGEVIVFICLLILGVIPGILYAIFISYRTRKDSEKRYCEKCDSSAIQLKSN